ncbi:MAG TPA: hypothetical protein VL595_15220, partial [Pseudonocardia sp.]|nr:hypothetical protein [Pseudonocardia sp.]
VTRLLRRQSMPDLETTRRLARVLCVPVRDMLIRSGRLTAAELPLPPEPGVPHLGAPEQEVDIDQPPTLEELAEVLRVPADRREMFVRVVWSVPADARRRGSGRGRGPGRR